MTQIVHMGDAVDAGVEKFAVVRHQQDAAGIARQILLQPQDGFEVEVVGGLVEQQQIGAVHQRAGQIEAHAPAAGEAADRALQRVVGETQPVQQLRGARLGARSRRWPRSGAAPRTRRHRAVPVPAFFPAGATRIAIEHEFQRGLRGVGDFLFDKGQRLAAAGSETSPPSGLISPRIRRNRVDLPQPFLPTRPMRWLAKVCRLAF